MTLEKLACFSRYKFRDIVRIARQPKLRAENTRSTSNIATKIIRDSATTFYAILFAAEKRKQL